MNGVEARDSNESLVTFFGIYAIISTIILSVLLVSLSQLKWRKQEFTWDVNLEKSVSKRLFLSATGNKIGKDGKKSTSKMRRGSLKEGSGMETSGKEKIIGYMNASNENENLIDTCLDTKDNPNVDSFKLRNAVGRSRSQLRKPEDHVVILDEIRKLETDTVEKKRKGNRSQTIIAPIETKEEEKEVKCEGFVCKSRKEFRRVVVPPRVEGTSRRKSDGKLFQEDRKTETQETQDGNVLAYPLVKVVNNGRDVHDRILQLLVTGEDRDSRLAASKSAPKFSCPTFTTPRSESSRSVAPRSVSPTPLTLISASPRSVSPRIAEPSAIADRNQEREGETIECGVELHRTDHPSIGPSSPSREPQVFQTPSPKISLTVNKTPVLGGQPEIYETDTPEPSRSSIEPSDSSVTTKSRPGSDFEQRCIFFSKPI